MSERYEMIMKRTNGLNTRTVDKQRRTRWKRNLPVVQDYAAAFVITVSSSYSRGVFKSYRSAILRGPSYVRRREKACWAICEDDDDDDAEVLAARCKLDMYAHTLLYTRMCISLYLYVNTWRQQQRQKRDSRLLSLAIMCLGNLIKLRDSDVT